MDSLLMFGSAMGVFALITAHLSIANLCACRLAVTSRIYGRVLPHSEGSTHHVISFEK